MTLAHAAQLLKEFGGTPDVSELGIELLLGDLPAIDRSRLLRALRASAVPHWFDGDVLASLLEVGADEAEWLAARLRRLPFVEPFPARGSIASNVHEASRRALRAQLRADRDGLFEHYSSRAAEHFAAGVAPHRIIERLFHRFSSEPEDAALECWHLASSWQADKNRESLLGLGIVLAELLEEDLKAGFVRGSAQACLARIRFEHQPLDETIQMARRALDELQNSQHPWTLAACHELLGDSLESRGDVSGALGEYRMSLQIREGLASAAGDDETRRRELSSAQSVVGDLLSRNAGVDGVASTYHDSARALGDLPAGTGFLAEETPYSRHAEKIESVLRHTTRSHRLSDDAADEFRSWARLRLLDNNQDLLRKYEARGQLRSFLVTVVQRLYLDWRNAEWGRWRPTAEARRLGPVAVALERLTTRDRLSFSEATNTLLTQGIATSHAECEDIWARLPRRPRRSRVDEAALSAVAVPGLQNKLEEEDDATRLRVALASAIASLPASDRFLLNLRYWNSLPLHQLTEVTGEDKARLSRRLRSITVKLKRILEQAGVQAGSLDALERG